MLVGWDRRLRGEDRLVLVFMWLQNHRTGLLGTVGLRELYFSTPREGKKQPEKAGPLNMLLKVVEWRCNLKMWLRRLLDHLVFCPWDYTGIHLD